MTKPREPRRPAGQSLTARLVVAAVAWLVVALAAGGIILAAAFRDTVERAFEERLTALLRAMTAAVDIAPDGSLSLPGSLGEPRFEQIYSGWYWQVDDGGPRPLRSRSLWDFALPVRPTAAGAIERRDELGPQHEPLLVMERDLQYPGRQSPVHILIAADRREIDAEVGRFNRLLLTALGSLGLGLLGAILAQVYFGLRPLRELAGDLERLAADRSNRLRGDYPREIAPLVLAMNRILDHDAELIARARTYVGNLAHALKTPLSIVKAELQSGSEGQNRTVVEQMDAMNRVIEHHLARARTEASSARVIGSKVPLGDVVDGLARALARIYAAKELSIETHVAAGLTALGEREDFEEILGNLMENACKSARTRVTVTGVRSGGRATAVTIEDDGPGLSAEEITEAAKRGIRLDEGMPGWGLGLAITADLVGLYGGELNFDRSPLGGLRVRVQLP